MREIEKELSRELGQCIASYGLIAEGDRVMVCMSGGKDSYGLLWLLDRARRRAPIDFSLVAVHLDQGHPGYDGTPLERWLADFGVEHRIVREDTYTIVKDRVPDGGTYCSLCSRLRRGVLYRVADELGATKIALGHHREDALETLLMNLMFTGSLGAMPPKLVSDDGKHVVIRPLLTCPEEKLAALAAQERFPILPCDLCGSQDGLMRKQVKELLADLETKAPRAKESMLAALGNVRASHLMDLSLRTSRVSEKRGSAEGVRRLPVVS